MNRYEEWLKTIESTPDLNGGGPILAPVFEKVLSGKKFDTAFEWCAGPAWIGMWLLENNICKTLITGDINKKAVHFSRITAKKNNYNIRSYVSDNLKQIPKREKFDLVVANPPNYCNIQKSHPLGFLREDLRPSDINWEIHKDFYLNGELYDKRPEIPMKDFKCMIKSNNLKIKRVIPYSVEDVECCMLEINKI